jgi:hypothetical protein
MNGNWSIAGAVREPVDIAIQARLQGWLRLPPVAGMPLKAAA